MLHASECPAYILAGGKSSRFGSDKALVEIDGQPQLLRLRRQLLGMQHRVSVVSDRRERFAPLGVESIVDTIPSAGPMSGLAAALADRQMQAGSGWLLLIGCDQYRWRQDWFEQLASMASDQENAVTFGNSNDAQQRCFRQPIPGLYHTRITASVAASLAKRQLALRKMLDALATAAVMPPINPREWSFNTREEVDVLRAREDGDRSQRSR